MRKLSILLGLAMLLNWQPGFSQTKTNTAMDEKWKEVEAFINQGKPESAKAVVKEILKTATANNQTDEIVKAKYLLTSFDQQKSEDKMTQINALETEIVKAKNPVEKAIWESLTAQAYQQYFENYSWQIYQRTTMESDSSTDMETWDAATFHKKISDLYLASVSNQAALKDVTIDKYKAIISKGLNTEKIRPTVYDFLMFEALSYFMSDERDVTNPALKFTIDDAKYFGSATEFAKLKIESKDPTSIHVKALQLFQDMLQHQINVNNIDALIDADIMRLTFVHDNATVENKDVLYQNSLKKLAQKYADKPAVAQALFLAIQNKYGGNEGYHPRGRQMQSDKKDLVSIHEELSQIITKFPKSEGAINAQNLLLQIEGVNLSVTVEDAYIPNENIKILLGYSNVNQVEIAIYETSLLQSRNEKHRGKLIKSFKQELVNAADFQRHTVEVKLDALPIGLYRIVITDPKSDASFSELLQLSNLAAIKENTNLKGKANDLLIVDRKTGFPIANSKVQKVAYEYQNKLKTYVGKFAGEIVGNSNGKIVMPQDLDYYRFGYAIINGKDTFAINQNEQYSFGRNYYNDNQGDKPNFQNFIFTDRSIYRPGQTIYFKGIVLKNVGAKQHEVVPNKEVNVQFKDVNGQLVKELKLTSNTYGSFTGSFTAPTTGLTGTMYIQTDYGTAYINVEEYKRPKFYVEFDTIKSNYKLNETIKIKGKALAYAGNNIDGASVKYRVERNVRYPYPWLCAWYFPSSESTEIANGTTTSDAQGVYEIDFKAYPDLSIDPKTLPIFTYTITADVTDINGETHAETQRISLGYHSLNIDINAPKNSLAIDLKSINIGTSNLNGVFTPANVTVKIKQLQTADKLYRERLWEAPTDYLYSESQYKDFFPFDMYKEEWKPENRAVIANIHTINITTTQEGKIDLPLNLWKQSGYYEIEAIAMDKDGKEMKEKQYIYVYVPEDKEQHDNALFVAAQKSQYQPGEQMKVFVHPAINKINLLQNNSWNKDLKLDNHQFSIPVTEADRGVFSFNYLYVYNNRVYTSSDAIGIPWSNKDLNISWASHRDKLQPGAQETWTLTVKGDKKEKVAAELIGAMYDASLDALKPHSWNWQKQWGEKPYYFSWANIGFGERSNSASKYADALSGEAKAYPSWNDYLFENNMFYDYELNNVVVYGQKVDRRGNASTDVAYEGAYSAPAADKKTLVKANVNFTTPENKRDEEVVGENKLTTDSADKKESSNNPKIQVRSNFQETAFFMPQMQTDAEGNIVLKFNMPEALTEWKFMAFAHTPDWKTGYLSGRIKTQKELMLIPNLPRFFRQGDKMTLACKVSNLSEKTLNGTAKIEILDAQTLQVLNLSFGFKDNVQRFSVAAKQSTVVNYDINIPQARFEPVIVRIVASAGDFSDGEENMIPVLTNRMLVTETQPLPVRGNTTANFKLEKLIHSAESNTLLNNSLTVEFTGNPAWYAVQALPYLMDFPYECAEQTFNRFYANALAGHIVVQSPKVAKVFEKWRTEDTAALLSNLEKNQELKTALLEETPWVLDAKNETEQKKNIARLFETHQLAKSLESTWNKLQKMQNSDGSFSWFAGMQGNRYITQYILTGLAKLQSLKVVAASNMETNAMLEKGMIYLDAAISKDYKDIKKEHLTQNNLGYTQIQYLYLRSFLSSSVGKNNLTAYNYYDAQAKKYWMKQNNYMQGMIAISQNRKGDKTIAKLIMESLSERALHHQELGMYWKNINSWWWYELPIETQSLLITAYDEVAKDQKSVDDMKLWLLKQKQTQSWPTTTATADACYALLKTGSDWLAYEPEVSIQLGDLNIQSKNEKTEAGTGYFKKRIEGKDVSANMGNISVTLDNKTDKNTGAAWGAVYWQYFENMDKITASSVDNPLKLSKELYIKENSDNGPILKRISEDKPLKVGDKITVRVILKTDRDMEYVHLKDMRAAGFEPINVLSGYKWNNGLGYYESTKDIATHFFIDYLRKGTYVFEYPLVVSQKGTFSNGISTIQCMYAPEFSAHTQGITVEVK